MAEENATPNPGSPEHEAAMVAKYEGTGNETPAENGSETPSGEAPAATTERPEWLPEKYKTVEEFVKSNAELEKKLGELTAEKKGGEGEETPNPEAEAAKDLAESKGLDYTAMSNEYWQNGSLSDATYETLDKAGIPRDVVDQFIAGQEAVSENLRLSAFTVVGGEENYNAMMSWAATNMDEAEIDAFNKAVNSNNTKVVTMAVMGLKGKYEAANGSEPSLVHGDGDGTVDTYETWAQVTADMGDPRYAKDAAYRSKVEAKLARSTPK